jgi:antitoxin HigA-1
MTIHNPLHPGVIIKDILIDGANLSVTEAASKIGVSRTTISRLLNGHSGIMRWTPKLGQVNKI